MSSLTNLKDIFAELRQIPGAYPTSYSRMSSCLRCPLEFDLRYRKKVKLDIQPSPAMTVGKMCHRLMESCVYKCTLFGFNLKASEFDKKYDEMMRDASPECRSIYQEIRDQVKITLEKIINLSAWKRPLIRTEHTVKLDHQADRFPKKIDKHDLNTATGVYGYVDLELISGNKMILVDYKTENLSEQRNEHVEQQMGLYAYIEMLTDRRIEEIDTKCAYLKEALFHPIKVYNNFKELEEQTIDFYNSYLGALKNFTAKPIANEFCKYCMYRNTSYCTLGC